MNGEGESTLEEDIESRFLEGLEENGDISEEVAEVIESLTDETDLGGRDNLVRGVKEVKGIDED